MQSSLRARRDSDASGPNNTVSGEAAPDQQPWFGRLLGLFRPKPPAKAVPDPSANALLAFRSEAGFRSEYQPIAEAPPSPARQSRRLLPSRIARAILVAAVLLVVASLAVVAGRRFPLSQLTLARPQAGSLTINTGAVASEVLVDGVARGVTPLKLTLAPGAHTVVVRSGSDERRVPVTIAAGADVTHNFEMKAAQPVARLGGMSVTTDPSGARVSVDGQFRGNSPLVIDNLTAQDHKVTVTNEAGSAERTVTITAGGTASVVFSLLKAPGPVGGWLTISAPFDVDVFDNKDVIGSSGASRIMLAAGRHDLTLANRTLGFEEVRRIDVVAGRTTAIRVEAPTASVSVNARPWADIILDGNNVGQTPIANLPVSIGSHEMVFRHPQLGERKQTVSVSVKGPNRIAVDLTK
jgi:hypothetical protein